MIFVGIPLHSTHVPYIRVFLIFEFCLRGGGGGGGGRPYLEKLSSHRRKAQRPDHKWRLGRRCFQKNLDEIILVTFVFGIACFAVMKVLALGLRLSLSLRRAAPNKKTRCLQCCPKYHFLCVCFLGSFERLFGISGRAFPTRNRGGGGQVMDGPAKLQIS